MSRRPPILVTRDEPRSARDGADPEAGRLATGWARKLAHVTGGRLTFAPPFVPMQMLLDAASKSGAGWIVTEPTRRALVGASLEPFDPDYGLLLRRAQAAVLSVQPWAEPPFSRPRTVVVGVDRSADAEAAARAAALLVAPDASGRLILVHGCATHPVELAARLPWRQLADRMRPDAHPWIVELAESLRSDALRVDVVVHPTWAPDLVGGMARRERADFVALGIRARGEECSCLPSRIHQRVLRGTACPLLTASSGG